MSVSTEFANFFLRDARMVRCPVLGHHKRVLSKGFSEPMSNTLQRGVPCFFAQKLKSLVFSSFFDIIVLVV